ncbi:MAG: hypothetical protein K2W96_06770, partial [Gemmataceae bacterium]|nr:hypothetical protein [Gemmataceae bacterium]
EFQGAAGTVDGTLHGSEVRFRTRQGSWRFAGAELAGLWFPSQEYVEGVLRLADWRALPTEALALLEASGRA